MTVSHYTQIWLAQYADESELNTKVNDQLRKLEDLGYAIVNVQFSMADNVAHQIMITYKT